MGLFCFVDSHHKRFYLQFPLAILRATRKHERESHIMTIKAIGEHLVCSECYHYAETGDATSLDFYYEEREAKERLDVIEAGLAELSFNFHERLVNLVADQSYCEEFSTKACECCGDTNAGERHKLIALADVDENEGE